MRTLAARSLIDWRKELIQDLGGEESVSSQRRALVDLATRTKLYVDHLDAWLLGQRSLIVTKRRAILPALRERAQLTDTLFRILQALGLERQAKAVPPLEGLLAAAAADGDGASGAGVKAP